MPLNTVAKVSDTARGLVDDAEAALWVDASGAAVVMNFFQKSILASKGYQVRAGTISVPLVGDVLITDTAAEFCVDSKSGLAVIPTACNIAINLAGGTAHEYVIKSVATASTGGTAFTPLPLLDVANGAASSASARVAAAGGVTVTAELNTTTRFHTGDGAGIAQGAYALNVHWEPNASVVLVDDECLYAQIAAATTGPSYHANLDFIEWGKGALGL